MSERESATGDLGLVQAFVNTLDLLPGEEKLTDPNTLRAWLVANRLLEPEQRVEEGDWKHALAVREAIRGLIGRNSGLRVYPGAVGAIGRLVASLYAAMQDDGWERLKLCGSDGCRWAYFDRSKNRSSRWCS